jgi:lipoyl(octanoyl) transferase
MTAALVQDDVAGVLPAFVSDAPAQAVDDFRIRRLGRSCYEPCWRAMQAFTDARGADTRDELWLTEHPPVYTLGLAGRREHVLRDNGIPIVKTDRGGQVTYHGPGQLVAYALVDLRRARLGVRAMVRAIEAAVIEWLAALRIESYGKPTAPGVYVMRKGGEAKIAALGLRIRNGASYHGVAVNLAMELAPFRDIDPCGYPGLAVTQVAHFTEAPGVEAAGATFAPILARHLHRDASNAR